MITMEVLLWMTFFLVTGILIGQEIVPEVVTIAQTQAALNQESLDLIAAAMNACPTETTTAEVTQ